jgi:hypothetical protein
LFEHLAALLNQIEVPVGGRIKRPGINSDALIQSSSQEERGFSVLSKEQQ